MGIRNFAAISIGEQTGVRVASVAAAGKVAIPTMEGGVAPKFVHVCAVGGTSTNIISVSPTQDTNGAIATGIPLSPLNPAGMILNVHGFTHIGYEDNGGGENTDLYIYPLEDF
jgi:hypothetical protein